MKDKAADILGRHCPGLTPLFMDQSTRRFRDKIVQAMREYAALSCQEQRKICSENAALAYEPGFCDEPGEAYIDKDLIINAPAPTMD